MSRATRLHPRIVFTRLAGAFLLLLLAPCWVSAQSALKLQWEPVSGAAGYQVSYGTQAGVYTRTLDVGTATSTTVTALDLGRWYYFAVRSYSAAGLYSAYSTEVPAFTTKLAGLSADETFPVPAGTPVTFTASAVAGSPALQYQFWLMSGSGWTMVQDYSASNSYSWTPTGADIGSHVVQVWARQPGATASLEDWASTGYVNVEGPQLTALVPNGASPFSTGAAITWTAVSNAPPGSVQYQFWRLNRNTGVWTMARDYAPDNTYTFVPGWNDAASYTLQVWIRSIGSTASFDTWLGTSFKVVRGVGALDANVVFPVPAGQPVTWTANAGDGSPAPQYQFWIYSAKSGWTSAPYSSSRTFTWTPPAGDEGSHTLQVWVRSAGSTASYEVWRGTPTFQIGPSPARIASIGLDQPPSTGVTSKITAIGGGGTTGPLLYKFLVYDVSAGIWRVVKDYSPDNWSDWTPSHSGSYNIQVWARSTGSTAAYEAWLGTSVTVQ